MPAIITLALFGKLTIMTATFAIQGYQLYILTDYLKISKDDVGHQLGTISIILMITALAMAVVAGPVSDKIGSRKGPVMLAGLLVAIGALVPFFSVAPWTMPGLCVDIGPWQRHFQFSRSGTECGSSSQC